MGVKLAPIKLPNKASTRVRTRVVIDAELVPEKIKLLEGGKFPNPERLGGISILYDESK